MSRRNKRDLKETHWRGLGVSDGIVIGRVLRLHTGTRQVYRATLEPGEIERETRRFRAAVRLARRQLLGIKSRAEKELGEEHAYIFDAHLLMLEDRKLLDDVEAYIRSEQASAEWAVKVVSDRLLSIYAEIKDDYLRERGSDIEDVTQRLLVALAGGEQSHSHQLTEDSVIVADNLLPSTVAELDFNYARAIATDTGGWTSHTAIIARGLGIPAVVGLRDLHRRARTGDEIIVDAKKGMVVLRPQASTVERYKAAVPQSVESRSLPQDAALEPLLTLDEREIFLRANIELPVEYAGVKRFGARGIGLYRSEFLLSRSGHLPSEDEQRETYLEIAQLAGKDGATVRLFDLGGEKISGINSNFERNPALGLRAIRFGLRHPELLRTQVRAIIRAAALGRLDIVLPMVSDVSDVRRAREIILEERLRLEQENTEIGPVRIGAMIEVPAAVMTAESLAREVDFFSLGTNDLVQYLLAVDRTNDDVADWFRSLHPAVLRSISHTVKAAEQAKIPVIVCGEMAATPVYNIVLTGLGATQFSMAPSSIPRVRRAVAAIRFDDAQQIAAQCLLCATADEIEELVRKEFSARWPHLFAPETLPPRRRRK